MKSKIVKGFPNYIVYENGQVYSIKRNKFLAYDYNIKGYIRVRIFNNGILKRFFVHRIVAFHFVHNDNPEINVIVNHLDENIHNNHYTNLEWTTPSGNINHSIQLRAKRLKDECPF